MNTEVLHILEFDRIREMLAERAASLMGKERARNLMPVSDVTAIGAALDDTREAELVLAWGSPPLGGIFDIRDSLNKVRLGAVLDTGELTDVLSTMLAMRGLKKFFKETELELPQLKAAAQGIEILGQLERELGDALDEHGNLRDEASPELSRLRRELRQSAVRIKDKMAAIVHNPDYQKFFQEAIVTMRDDRYVVPVKQEYRYQMPGLIHDQSASGATLFIEPLAVAELNNDIKQLTLAEKQEVERILRRLTDKISREAAKLAANVSILTQIDFAFAKAKLARDMGAVRPIMNAEGRTRLQAARHPLIPAETVVPIDIVLGDDYTMLLITGPNTGGKTVSMKTLGLLVLMAQSGCFIPAAQGSELAIYRHVYADIGDEQSIEQSLSTFSAHMTNLVRILDRAEPQDLLLLDEIGAGTDPEEGAALAMAVAEQLLALKVSVIATTHYTALKTFAFNRPGMENACVEFDGETLRPTYRLLIGMPGASNAFAISLRLGLAESVVNRAKELVAADHARFEQVVGRLEREKLLYEQMNADIREKQRQAAAQEAEALALKRKLGEEKTEIIRKAKEQSAALVRRTRREAEAVIKDLKAQFDDQGIRKRQQAIESARRGLDDAAARVAPSLGGAKGIGTKLDASAVAKGDLIYVTKLGERGTVLAVRGNELEVEVGALKTMVKAKDCRFLGHPQRESAPKSAGLAAAKLNRQKVATVTRQVDIRGLMVDEAESVLGKFIDDAVIGGLGQILIIHGKGTGALRRGVHEYLKRHKNVASYRLADISEGGTGATEAELK